jgi:Predicted nucleotide-binding protein containing TIR-like domain
LEQRLFRAHPGSENHEKAKYLLEKRRHEEEMAKKAETKPIEPSFTGEQGISALTGLHREGSAFLSKRPLVMEDVYAWIQKGRELLIRCFGSNSKIIFDFEFAGANSWPENDTPGAWDALHAKTLNYQLKLIENSIELLQIEQMPKNPQSIPGSDAKLGNSVFLVHGRDEAVRDKVARFLEQLDLEPVILQEQADKGRTVIEKFIDHSTEVGFAVVLLTADDRGGPRESKYEEQHFRARQNVWLELGFFIGKLLRPA